MATASSPFPSFRQLCSFLLPLLSFLISSTFAETDKQEVQENLEKGGWAVIYSNLLNQENSAVDADLLISLTNKFLQKEAGQDNEDIKEMDGEGWREDVNPKTLNPKTLNPKPLNEPAEVKMEEVKELLEKAIANPGNVVNGSLGDDSVDLVYGVATYETWEEKKQEIGGDLPDSMREGETGEATEVDVSNSLNAEETKTLKPSTEKQAYIKVRGQARNFHFTNRCGFQVSLLIHYMAMNKRWYSLGWWTVNPKTWIILSNRGTRLRSDHRVWYFYAKSKSGRTVWSGKHRFSYRGTRYGMRKKSYTGGRQLKWSVC